MRIAIVHYHLRSGGVFRVVRNTLAAFAESDCRFGIIVGEAPGGDQFPEGSYACVPELRYAGEAPDSSPEDLVKRLRETAQDLLGGPPDLWHFHNHSLGKNFVAPRACRLLAEAGEKLLLQIHDFAEDGRPNNFRKLLAHTGDGDFAELSRQVYPRGANVHYGVLNGRDKGFLEAAGAAPERVHLLSNPVSFGETEPADRAGQGEFVLYPTRAIRRKNLGEFLLLRLLDSRTDRRWAVTMAPENPEARPIYEEWVELAKGLGLDIEFEWGSRCGLPFPDLIAASQFLVTTSVAEGFGLAFLEPFLLGKQIFGRDLPEITADFADEGIDLNGLYTKLPVPRDLFDAHAFDERAREELHRYYRHYGQSAPPNALDRFLAEVMDDDGTIDFGRLDEPAQAQVLRQYQQSAQRPSLSRFIEETAIGRTDQVQRNRKIIEEKFSLSAYARRLSGVYETVAQSPAEFQGDSLDSHKILDEFLAPERFMPIRT